MLESVADFPLLKINGEVERSKTLCDGDVIDIGRFQLVARISSSLNASSVEQRSAERLENVHTILEPVDDDLSVEQETEKESVDEEKSIENEVEMESIPQEELGIHDGSGDEATDDELSIPARIVDGDEELSAEELVDLIKSEQQIVEQFEERQRIGADALIQTVRKRAESLEVRSEEALPVDADKESIVSDNEIDSDCSHNLGSVQSDNNVDDALPEDVQLIIHSEVEKVLEQLHGLSEELDRRTERLSMRESGYAEAAACLLDAQYKLTTQLEKLVVRLSSLQADQSDDQMPHRAVA